MDYLIYDDLPELPLAEMLKYPYHLLIAGCTRSGKSVLLHKIIAEGLRQGAGLILCDPKMIEFAQYKKARDVLIYANNLFTIRNALEGARDLMNARYKKMLKSGARVCSQYPIWVIVDEFADLLQSDKKTFEPLLVKLAQLCAGANIKLIIATQAPNRKTITANISANFVQRIGLHADSAIESRQIIGTNQCCDLPMPQDAGIGTCYAKTPGHDPRPYKITMEV